MRYEGDMHPNSFQFQRGLAALEGAMWLTVSVPLLIIALQISAETYDLSVTQSVAHESVANEVLASKQGLLSIGEDSGQFAVALNLEQSSAILSNLSTSAAHSVAARTLNTQEVSSQACVWQVGINVVSGQPNKIIREVCRLTGPLASQISFTTELQQFFKSSLGAPREDGAAGYLETASAIGVKIIFTQRNFGVLPNSTRGFGEIMTPRKEYQL